MDTIFRVLFLHMRTFWRRARGLFVSIWFQRLHTSGSQKNTSSTHIQRPPTPIPQSPSGTTSRIPPTISMARTKAWACLRTRKLKARMRERRIAKKQAMYARIAAGAAAMTVGKGKEGAKGEDEDEEDEEEVQEGDEPFEAPSSSSEPGVGTCRSPSPLPPLPWRASTSALGLELQLELGYAFPSPTDSSASSGSNTTEPRTPVTPMTPMTTPLTPIGSFHFPGSRERVATESPASPATLRARRARGRFRTLSASITARSPLSLSFPLSFSLPLTARRASSPNVTMQRCMTDGEADREGVDGEGAARREGEDPFGTHGSGYYAPGARAALGLGDAYDLSAWAWARDCSPRRRAKKRMRAATTGSVSVYRAPGYAASAPQLTYAQHTDGELEYSRMLANASAGTAGGKTTRVVPTLVPANTSTHESEPAAGPRRGMRPLLLPQKLGLLAISATSGSDRKPEYEAERADSCSPGRCESKVSGWDVDLERGVCRGEEVAKAYGVGRD